MRHQLPVLVLLMLVVRAAAADPASDGERLRKAGRYGEAEKLLEAAVQKDPRALAARLQLGLVYRATGRNADERAVWNRFYDDYEGGRIDKHKARELMYVAMAARFLGGWQDANDTFRDAVDADPKGKDGARANIEWAALFLEKYDAAHAEQSLDEALKVLPDDADAHALMARVRMEQNDIGAAERELTAALKKDPKHSLALDLRAEELVDDERWTDAVLAAKRALEVNPEDARARTLIAAVAWLRDDKNNFVQQRDHVLHVNAHCWELFHGVAEFLVKAHRYVEANELEEEALKVEPKSWVALAALGSNWLRLGEDDKGLSALREAWKRDPYNVRTYNLLNLFEDVIPKDYVLVDGTPFRFRVTKKEKPLILHYVKPLVEREYAELVKRFGFTPEGPLTIELFANPEHYAVRTVGLPGLEALGVTFGKVITGMSPMGGRFNWGMMIWHEVAHIFSIQMSRARVPRWFTEGLSEYETQRLDATWTRRTHAELYRALLDGKLRSVAELDAGFTRARDVAHMVVTYHQAAEEVMFLIRRFGFDAAKKSLALFAQGKLTAEVIPAVTGMSIKDYDAAFAADLRGRSKAYENTFFVRSSDFSDVAALKEQLAGNPKDERAKAMLALALIHAHQGEEAQKLLDVSPENLPTRPREMILAAAEEALLQKNRELAKTFLRGLTSVVNGDGYDARFLLGKVAAEEGDLVEAKKQLALAKKMDPDMADPYVVLAKALLKTDVNGALAELETAAQLEVMDGSIPKLLVEEYAKEQRWAELVHAARLSQFIDPYDVDVYQKLAVALMALGKHVEAKAEIALALQCDVSDEQRVALQALLAAAQHGKPAPQQSVTGAKANAPPPPTAH
jgi:tetratricopeptide (TPR) repeat protein